MKYNPQKISKAMQKAARSTINKTMRAAQKKARISVRKVYAIKNRDLRERTVTTWAKDNDLKSSFIVKGRRFPLIIFNASQKRSWPGARFRVKRQGKRKTLKSSFIATVSGKKNVYKRKGRERLPIKVQHTVDPATMFEREGMQEFEKTIKEKSALIIDQELRFFISRSIRK